MVAGWKKERQNGGQLNQMSSSKWEPASCSMAQGKQEHTGEAGTTCGCPIQADGFLVSTSGEGPQSYHFRKWCSYHLELGGWGQTLKLILSEWGLKQTQGFFYKNAPSEQTGAGSAADFTDTRVVSDASVSFTNVYRYICLSQSNPTTGQDLLYTSHRKSTYCTQHHVDQLRQLTYKPVVSGKQCFDCPRSNPINTQIRTQLLQITNEFNTASARLYPNEVRTDRGLSHSWPDFSIDVCWICFWAWGLCALIVWPVTRLCHPLNKDFGFYFLMVCWD